MEDRPVFDQPQTHRPTHPESGRMGGGPDRSAVRVGVETPRPPVARSG